MPNDNCNSVRTYTKSKKNAVRAVRLKKDIVIPAGTIFSQAPRRIEMNADHVEGLIGLTPNTCMSLIQDVDMSLEENNEWWEEI